MRLNFQFDLTHEVELIKHLFVVSPKAQLFEMPNIYSVIM